MEANLLDSSVPVNETPYLSEDELRYWLVNEDWYLSQHTRRWLEETPRPVAADLLAHIAQDAALEPMNLWALFVLIFVVSGFSPSNAIAGKKMDRRKAGTRAALLLSDLNDARCLSPLVRLWPRRGFQQNKYQELIEIALLQTLRNAADRADYLPLTTQMEQLIGHVWATQGQRRDLTRRETDILIAAIHALRSFGIAVEPATFGEISRNQPNRQKVQDALAEAS